MWRSMPRAELLTYRDNLVTSLRAYLNPIILPRYRIGPGGCAIRRLPDLPAGVCSGPGPATGRMR